MAIPRNGICAGAIKVRQRNRNRFFLVKNFIGLLHHISAHICPLKTCLPSFAKNKDVVEVVLRYFYRNCSRAARCGSFVRAGFGLLVVSYG
jgi:hypothetical protein